MNKYFNFKVGQIVKSKVDLNSSISGTIHKGDIGVVIDTSYSEYIPTVKFFNGKTVPNLPSYWLDLLENENESFNS